MQSFYLPAGEDGVGVGFFNVPVEEEKSGESKFCGPVVLAFVLDCSGSMDIPVPGKCKQRTRWEWVVKCMNLLAEDRKRCNVPGDRIVVVTFNHRAEVTVPLQLLETWVPGVLEKKIPSGYTNISAGDELMHQVLENFLSSNEGISSTTGGGSTVLNVQLTDGFANFGVTNRNDLAKMKREHSKALEKKFAADIIHGFYAVSTDSDPDLPEKYATVLGSDCSLYRHIQDHDFMEFGGEMGLLFGLVQLHKKIRLGNTVLSVIRGTWTPHIVRVSEADAQGIRLVDLPELGNLIVACLDFKRVLPMDFSILEHIVEKLGGQPAVLPLETQDDHAQCVRVCKYVDELTDLFAGGIEVVVRELLVHRCVDELKPLPLMREMTQCSDALQDLVVDYKKRLQS